MAKRSIRLFSFAALFTLLFYLLNLSMKVESPRWEDFYKIPKNSIDVMFMGNSHNFSSFQPQIIDNVLPIRSYVVGISAENIIVSYYELRDVLKYQHPKVVVLETFTLDLADTRDFGYIFGFLDAGKWNANRMAIAMRYLTPETAYSIFPALRTRMDWKKPYLYLDQLLQEIDKKIHRVAPDLSNPSIKDTVISDAAYRAAENLPAREYPEPNPDIAVYLEKFYQLCQENDIQLVLATAPIVNSTPNQNEYFKPFDTSSFIGQNNIPTIDYDPAQFNHLHFGNETHINGFGSVIISLETAKRLSQIMNLPLDNAAFDYYQSFVFSDYQTYQDGNDFKIELIPTYEKSNLEYQWTVRDKKKNIILTSDWQSESSITFPFDPDKPYQVFVDIRNPSSDYSMAADFSITGSQ